MTNEICHPERNAVESKDPSRREVEGIPPLWSE